MDWSMIPVILLIVGFFIVLMLFMSKCDFKKEQDIMYKQQVHEMEMQLMNCKKGKP